MSSPLPPMPGETAEQRQARFAAADAVQARIDAQRRAEEARRVPAAPMMQPAPQGLMLSNVPQQPAGGLTLANVPRADPGFDINTATNTFFKALADRVASGQMTLDQARAAQAQMRQLQLNPQMANRAAATEVAQRALQVGPYAPQSAVIDNRIGFGFGKPMTPEGPKGLAGMGGMLANFAEQFRNAQGMAKPYASVPRQLTREEAIAISSMPQRAQPATLPMQPLGMPLQAQMAQPAPQGMTLSNVPQQQRLTLSAAPVQPQGMAMGGLMDKYYGGGMC